MSRKIGRRTIILRSLRQHALSTAITVIAVGLAVGLTISVFSIRQQTYNAFTGGQTGFDAILGARGAPLQLVLNAVFHLETSPGNIPWSMYQQMKSDPRVELAVPYAVGDNYYGYRLVGTTTELFTEFEYREGQKLTPAAGGRLFDPNRMEAVLGHYAAEKTGLTVGSTFSPFHGLYFDPGTEHQEVYTVVGILEPTNSPTDRIFLIPIEGVFRMEGHVLRGSGEVFVPESGNEIPDEHKEVSAVMLKFGSPQTGFMFDQLINKQGKVATLAWPIGAIMADLFDKIGWMNSVLALVAYLVIIVAAGTIMASLYNTMNERRREFAILRALGARRRTVFQVIVLEATSIAAIGTLVGLGIYLMILSVAAAIIREQTGVVLDLMAYDASLVWVPALMVILGAVTGVVPAIKAYRTAVGENLVAGA